MRRRISAYGLTFSLPLLIWQLLFFVFPLVFLIALSFWTVRNFRMQADFDTVNWTTMYGRAIFWQAYGTTLTLAAGAAVLTSLLAFPVAYFLSFVVAPRHKAMWIFLITIPFWTSYLIRVFLWKVILGYNGVVNSGLKSLGIIEQPLSFLLYNTGSIVVTLAHAYAPFAILPIYVALEKIDRSLLEAGRDLGESRLMTFWRVTLPLAMPGVLAAVLIVFIPTIGDYVTPTLIGGGKIPMVANLIQAQMLDIDNKPLGSAIAVTAMGIVGVLSLIFLFLNRRFLRMR